MSQPAASFSPRRALQALARLLRDPDDLPQVFTVIQSLSGRTPTRMLRQLRATAGALVDARPDIVPTLADREALRRLPAGSLGRAYLAFVESEGISAEGIIEANERGRVAVAEEVPAELVWLQHRMRDTHDLWHALTGYKGDVLGEAALLAFIFAQTGNPGVGLMVGAALLKTIGERDARRVILDGFRRGRRAAWLPAVAWESLLARPVDEVRVELGVDSLPSYTPLRSAELRARAAAA